VLLDSPTIAGVRVRVRVRVRILQFPVLLDPPHNCWG
jgi:hypothetical protein